LQLARAALAKLLNSLSWEPALIVPSAVDEDRIVLSVDLRRLGWDRGDLWAEVLKPYPYGLKHDNAADPLNKLDEEIRTLTGEDLPYVRADWFVATASQPPLYYTLLRLPSTARELEEKLGIDPQADLARDKVARAGLARGTATGGSQIFERHEAPGGGYWTTYDLGSDPGNGDIFRFPLAPDSSGAPPPAETFVLTSRSILFPLPNGLQGYLLVDRDGKRCDSALSGVAHELRQATGRPSLVNGLSCIACHREGVFPIKDEVRRKTSVTGQALEKVKAVYPDSADLERLTSQDRQRFLRACEELAATHETIEPVSALALRFDKELGPNEIAVELGVQEPEVVLKKLREVPRFRKLGLGPLFDGRGITREVWNNAFDQAAIELDVGTPQRSF
jgi:serine/threonine-protein kinase